VDVLPEEAVMIGDGLDDYRASKVSGTDFLAATYGYELNEDYCVKHGLKYVNSPSEISDKF
jgi:phosphoglycolate phosphatase-like HAD superfamily hydrolase